MNRDSGTAGAWWHSRDLGLAEVVAFLNHLARREHVTAGTQNQALNALVFLYTQRDAALVAEVGNHEWTRINTNEEAEKWGALAGR